MKRINLRSLIVIVFSLVLAFGLGQPVPASAQTGSNTMITGHVKDPQGASLPGATVTLYSRDGSFSLTTTTDSTGTYRFERLTTGEYLVEAEAKGFASANAQQVVVDRAQAVTLDISLELSGVRSTVVVIASDTPQSVDEVSKAVTVVDRQSIDERDESQIAESLRTVPGLRVQQLGGPGAFTSIKTRGLRNEDTAVD
jgi:iron complex outermembrane receptor protein